LLGISDRRVRQLKSEGMFAIPQGRRKHELRECIAEWVSYRENLAHSAAHSPDLEAERARHERIKTEISTLRLRRLRAELHDADAVARVLSDMCVRFRNRIMAAGQKLAPLLTGRCEPGEITKIIDEENVDALRELSEYDPAMFIGAGGANDEAGEGEDEDGDEEVGGGGAAQ